MVTVLTLRCPNCLETIFSRSRHDFRYCSCGSCWIDGGTDPTQTRHGWCNCDKPLVKEQDVAATKADLHQDYNLRTNVFGKIVE